MFHVQGGIRVISITDALDSWQIKVATCMGNYNLRKVDKPTGKNNTHQENSPKKTTKTVIVLYLPALCNTLSLIPALNNE